MEKEIVLVTGITGYVGNWVGKMLLEQCPQFKLRASVRSLKKAEALLPVYGQAYYDSIEFVQADLTDDLSMAEAIKGAAYVIHVASAVVSSSVKYKKDEMEKDAIRGTKVILDACKQNKVKKLIVTSSVMTVIDLRKAASHFTEDDFAFGLPDSYLDAYTKSKIMQEQELLRYTKEMAPKGFTTEVCTLHPGFIIGPVLTKTWTGSVDGVRQLAQGSLAIPELYQPSVDVRDVAQAHINAMLARPGLMANQRINLI